MHDTYVQVQNFRTMDGIVHHLDINGTQVLADMLQELGARQDQITMKQNYPRLQLSAVPLYS